jgi:hypothetical protein
MAHHNRYKQIASEPWWATMNPQILTMYQAWKHRLPVVCVVRSPSTGREIQYECLITHMDYDLVDGPRAHFEKIPDTPIITQWLTSDSETDEPESIKFVSTLPEPPSDLEIPLNPVSEPDHPLNKFKMKVNTWQADVSPENSMVNRNSFLPPDHSTLISGTVSGLLEKGSHGSGEQS